MFKSFQTKLALFFTALFLLLQGAAFFSVREAIVQNIFDQSRDQLVAANRIFAERIQTRVAALAEGAQILASDFGFRTAVATNDKPTILSALDNLGARISANRVLLINLDYEVVADTGNPDAAPTEFPFFDLVDLAETDERAEAFTMLDGVIYELVVVPVLAPVPISYIAIGIEIDSAFAQDLRAQSTLSLENGAIAWTSPYTISSSAINSWVGEELKTIGVEAKVTRSFEDFDASFTAASFIANDPAGSLLAWRGWAIHDREAGLFDQLPLAPLRSIEPGGSFDQQARWVEPFHQIDSRLGAYVGIDIDHYALGALSVLYYDNQSFDRAFDGFQYAWDTYFVSVGYKNILPGDIELIGQFMEGNTSMGTRPILGSKVDNDFWSTFVMLSKRFGRHRFSLRYDHFEIADDDFTPDDLNQETGNAVTAAYVLRPFDKQRFTFEVLHIGSKRPERAFLNEPVRARETLLQASYRFFL